MTVYVDQITDYGGSVKGYVGKVSQRWCHMTADTLEELHAMADRIGMKRSWYQPGAWLHLCHYDLTPGKRVAAVAAGAVEVQAMAHLRQLMAEGRDRVAVPGIPVSRPSADMGNPISGVVVVNAHKLAEVSAGYTLVYVGRRSSYRPELGLDFSVLGNPFTLASGYSRDEAVEAYADRVTRGMPLIVRRAMDVLRQRAVDERLALVCFCHPQRCHADVIKKELEGGME
ncbi:DUF4031 domain-containing protein [uncultured Deinococcus sp.]|uniref:DUF4031 domain-containing protein n=1 Tax=uncultured Deinococcus sp. TaxID=158789 RepID=UPI00258D984B|nr:DUF4031 domain-containing protein [uncultured Deinococcus sp.]